MNKQEQELAEMYENEARPLITQYNGHLKTQSELKKELIAIDQKMVHFATEHNIDWQMLDGKYWFVTNEGEGIAPEVSNFFEE